MGNESPNWRAVLAIGIGCVAILAAAATPVHASGSPKSSLIPTIIQPPPAPPPGFNPLTATPSMLKEYGFPSRPTSASALSQWTQAMQSAKYYVAPQQTAGTMPHGTSYTPNGAGYVALPGGGTSVVESTATWVQPRFNEGGSAGDPSFWTGIGGWHSNYVVQAGADSGANQPGIGGSTQYEFWVEDFTNATIWEATPKVYPTSTLYVDVNYYGATSSAFLENESTGYYTTVNFNSPHYSGNSADFINEAVGFQTLGYPSWGSTAFSGCQLFLSNGSGGLFQTFPTTRIVMTNTGTSSGTVEAAPGPINTNTNGFSITSY